MERTHRGVALGLVLAVAGLAACETETQDEMDGAVTQEETGGMAEDAIGGPIEAVQIDLEPVGDSNIRGHAVATHSNDAIQVAVSVEGLTAGTEYPAHIHAGTCEDGGPVVVGLQSITAASGTVGTSTTTLEPSQLQGDQESFVQVHGPDGQPIACGDIEGHGDAGTAL